MNLLDVNVSNIIEAVSTTDRLPIQIECVIEIIKACEYQDDIKVVGVTPRAGNSPRGLLYRYRSRANHDGSNSMVSLIPYDRTQPFEWQRLTCCKELVHICDPVIEHVATPASVKGLFDSLVDTMQNNGNISGNERSYYLALRDSVGVYPALAILFPQAARQRALEMRHSGERSLQQIAQWASLPEPFVNLALHPEWPSVLASIMTTAAQFVNERGTA